MGRSRRLVPVLVAVGALGALAVLPAGAQAAAPKCRSFRLAGAIIDQQGAAGTLSGRLILVNKSQRACRMRGFPKGFFIGTNGMPINTHITHRQSPRRNVRVGPGEAAAFGLSWSDVPRGNNPCPRARWLMIQPPGIAARRSVAVHFGSTPCGGRLQVGPIVDPSSA
jgi:hypothetical protein